MDHAGQWIPGTKDGRPVLFNLQTGETMTQESPHKRKKFKRKRPNSSKKNFEKLLNHVATESSSSHWVSGQRDGRQIYFNTITKEERMTPPEAVGKVERDVPTATVTSLSLPEEESLLELLSTEDATPMDMDREDQDLMEMLAFQIDRKAMEQETPSSSTTSVSETSSPHPVAVKSKAEILRQKNREAAARSRMKKAKKIATLESKIIEMQGENTKLRSQLIARDTTISGLRSEIAFYRSILTERLRSSSSSSK